MEPIGAAPIVTRPAPVILASSRTTETELAAAHLTPASRAVLPDALNPAIGLQAMPYDWCTKGVCRTLGRYVHDTDRAPPTPSPPDSPAVAARCARTP